MPNDSLNSFQDIHPVLDISLAEKRPLLIIAKEIEGDGLNGLLVNLAGERIRACAIRAPDFGDDQVEVLNVIAVLLGGNVFNSTVGDDFSKAKLEDLGSASKVRVSRTQTMLINDNSNQEAINDRVGLLSAQLSNQTNDWFAEKIHRRIGKLTGGVAVVKVGAATETELRERKERLDDALNATKCAVQEGIVVGGGMALYGWAKEESFYQAFSAPARVIAANAGITLNEERLKDGIGFNANRNKYENLFNAGIIDPVKVTKNAVLTAVSIAGLVLTTNVLVGEKEEPQWG